MICRQVSVCTFACDLAISSESCSTSVSPRWRKISPARSSPTATRRMAAFLMPGSFTPPDAVTTSVPIPDSVLGHPLLDLRRDALRLAVDQLVELLQARVRAPGRQRGGVRLERRRGGGALL